MLSELSPRDSQDTGKRDTAGERGKTLGLRLPQHRTSPIWPEKGPCLRRPQPPGAPAGRRALCKPRDQSDYRIWGNYINDTLAPTSTTKDKAKSHGWHQGGPTLLHCVTL